MDNDPTDLVEQQKRERAESDLETIRAFHEADDFKWIMSDEKGRRFIWAILERSGLFTQAFDGTAEGTIFADGVKNEGRLIMGLIFAHCPEAFAKMILEQENAGRQPTD